MRIRAVILCLCACVACKTADRTRSSDARMPVSYFTAQADSGAAAWNRGDIAAYLAPYDDSVVVVYPDGPHRGRDSLEAVQRRGATWGGTPPAEQARIGANDARYLSDSTVLQTAEIILQRKDESVRRLWATVVWRKTPAGWRVIHEQSF